MKFKSRLLGLLGALTLLPALASAQVPEGQPAPKVSMKLLKDGVISDFPGWDAYKSKIVVVELWGTWCPPCVASIPHMNDLQRALQGKPVEFISITDEGESIIRKFLKRNPMSSAVAVDGGDAVRALGTGKFPLTIIISKTGTVLRYTEPRQLSEKNLGQLLDKGSVSGIKRVLSDKPKSHKDKTETPPFFEVRVTTVPDDGERGSGFSEWPNAVGRVYEGLDLPRLLSDNYGIGVPQIEISSGITRQKFRFSVRTPKSSENMLKPLLRQAIEVAYGAEVRLVRKEKQVLVLTYDKAVSHGGLSPSAAGATVMKTTDKYVIGTNVGINDILKTFEKLSDMPVIDETGLTGRYDVELDGALKDKEALSTAIQDQFGMKLTPATRSIDVLEVVPVGSGPADRA